VGTNNNGQISFSSPDTRTRIVIAYVKYHNNDNSGATPRLSNANQSPVPVGNNPMLRHFHNPTASVNRLHSRYTTFCSGRVMIDFAEAVVGANGANAELMVAMFLNGLIRSMNTMPILNICTPPPDMYNMKACIGSDLAGPIAKSQARFSFRLA